MSGHQGPAVPMPFIFTDCKGKSQPEKRKLIRQHVMLGKNRGKTRKGTGKSNTSSVTETYKDVQDGSSALIVKLQYSRIPDRVGNELSFTQFAAPVEPPLMQELLKFSLMAKRLLYPLESCIEFHKKNEIDTLWFDLLTLDAAYLHAVLFLCQTYSSLISEHESPIATQRALTHHSITLHLLRERLSKESQVDLISDATVLIVLNLARHSHLVHEDASASHHMGGLRKIVNLRGGLNAFRCDLMIAVDNGKKPIFFQDPVFEPLFPHDLVLPGADQSDFNLGSSSNSAESQINDDLSGAYSAMRRFCLAINIASKHNRQLPKEILLNTMASVMYRLLGMSFKPTTIDEIFRLGLLAFSSHIFLRLRDVKPSHTRFPDAYRKSLLQFNTSEGSSSILPWLIMIGGLSVFGPADGPWLIPCLQANIESWGLETWNDLRAYLKQFLWIDFLHDKPGEAMYRLAIAEKK
ncbi:hypothetical protein N7448_002493 [Penicillium atrosanguineum]|uniref:DNA mismatch repair protein Msh6 n=1 Tax=Penicillium atrosanguineum TaxID=1132637 RepID=UPI00239281B1|nr:DNA mismatch repair protein Msh6 [Penicillium atrosanguineum]KAJ5145101.1 hypothetical protein N7448_002493 [Penicillium atrosanguineum]KAJ5300892.1 DNA mismatch repair protein Msh6 [Penicillium atrosanguineum]